MQPNKVSALAVIRAFYVANELMGDVFGGFPEPTKKKIESRLKKIIKQSEKLSKKNLLTYHLDNYHPRYDNYLNSKWELREITLEECGVWPRMGGLPDKATKDSVMDTAKYVQECIKDRKKLTWKTRRVLYIEEMKKYADIITKSVPIIVLEDGVIRNMKLLTAIERKMYKKCKYDIDDGNHRAVALALLGKKKIKAFVGKRICKSSLLYYR